MSALTIIPLSVLIIIAVMFILCSIEAAIALSSPFYKQNELEREVGIANHDKKQQKDMMESAKRLTMLDYVPYTVKSVDGYKLFAKFFKGEKDKPYVILMHGYRGVAERDFGYIMPMLMKYGYNILLVDERSCGQSEGHSITFGIKERKDIRSWSYFLLKTFGRDIQIVLFGVSMGAASVLMATELNLPHAVQCIIADCPYSSPKEIIKKTAKNIRFPSRLSYQMIRIGAFLYAKIDLEGAAPKDAVRHTDIPIMLMHGEKDNFVPAYMSRDIEEQCFGYVERHTFKEADHAYSSLVEPERYERLMISFIEKFCKRM